MYHHLFRGALALAILTSLAPCGWGQMAGMRLGVEPESSSNQELPLLDREVVEGFIAIDGRAEVRVRPTEIRIVLAITSEGATAMECDSAIEKSLAIVKGAWAELGIPATSVVEDFIAVLPVYQWQIEKQNESNVGVERKTGYRMQTNIHLAVPNDATAPKAVAAAFQHGVTDIIAFDYWSLNIDQYKIQARDLAVKAARNKSDSFFKVLFDSPPKLINVQEATKVHYPHSMYRSFVNSHDEEFVAPWRHEITTIKAYRPRNTYYHGLDFNGDIQASYLPMKPEISVVSTVRLYYESAASKRTEKDDSDD